MKANYLAATSFVLAASLMLTTTAGAYEREKTSGGVPLSWHTLPVPYSINSVCSGDDTPAESCQAAVKAGYSTWGQQECTDYNFSEPVITDSTETGQDNQNLIVWRSSDWHFGNSVLGMTTLTYDDKTGEIVDADIEINGQDWEWRVLTTTSAKYIDIQTVVVHESGHIVGLDHSTDPSAVMYFSSKAGHIKRDLAQDDIDGVCTIYPKSKPEPPPSGGGGCSVVSVGI